MSIFAKRMITLSVVLTGLLLAVLPVFFPNPTDRMIHAFAVSGGFVAFGALVWSWAVLRCPHCGASLPLRLVGCPLSPLRQKIRREIQRSLKHMYAR